MSAVPVVPPTANKWLSDQFGKPSMTAKFPLNLCAEGLIPFDVQQKIFRYMQDNYIWPQVQERTAFEPLWDNLLKLARINIDKFDLNWDADSKVAQDEEGRGTVAPKMSDSIIFDAIDRLSNINHFISFKDGFPGQFIDQEFVERPYETDVYSPTKRKIKASNALLRWNGSNVDFYRKHLICCRHHYTYGMCYAKSEFELVVEYILRQMNNGGILNRQEITRLGTTFDPISIRRLWLNYRLPAWEMDSQPCPFYVEPTPYFAMLQNAYHPDLNPFGYANLDKIKPDTMGFHSAPESKALLEAMRNRCEAAFKGINGDGALQTLPQILEEKYSVNGRYKFYPMLPLDPETGEWETRVDGTAVPFARFIVTTYGSNLTTDQTMLQLQSFFYPKKKLPIYGSAHMPDLDSGQYSPSIGELLFNHYKEIVTCTNQHIANKEWINNPPAWVQTSSPCQNQDLNRPGSRLKVNGPNDFGWRLPYDATASTAAVRQMLRDEAQTTSKAVDAILGKAMGGRTSATEASNAYQTSMSGITTDINIFNYDITGGFMDRVWDYCGTFMDPQLLYAITGSFGFAMNPEDMWISLGKKTNVGSTYIESIVRQQNLRYIAESTRGEPCIRRDKVYLALFEEMKFGNPREMVIDGGLAREISRAVLQAEKTYLGEPVLVAPDQNHQIAMMVKMDFINDEESKWNKEHPENIPALIQQIEVHQAFFNMQQEAQASIATLQNLSGDGASPSGGPVIPGMPAMMQQPGQVAQQNPPPVV